MSTVGETRVRTPRLAVWGFALSLAAIVLSIVAMAVFTETPGELTATPPDLFSGLLSIPGLVLSWWGLRVARKRHARRRWAIAGLVLGIVWTMVLVLFGVLLLLVYSMTSDPSFGA